MNYVNKPSSLDFSKKVIVKYMSRLNYSLSKRKTIEIWDELSQFKIFCSSVSQRFKHARRAQVMWPSFALLNKTGVDWIAMHGLDTLIECVQV